MKRCSKNNSLLLYFRYLFKNQGEFGGIKKDFKGLNGLSMDISEFRIIKSHLKGLNSRSGDIGAI